MMRTATRPIGRVIDATVLARLRGLPRAAVERCLAERASALPPRPRRDRAAARLAAWAAKLQAARQRG